LEYNKEGISMAAEQIATIEVFDEIRPGDRVEIEQTVVVGIKSWKTKTRGTVVRVERRRHGLHFHRNFDDKVYSDAILLRQSDGELTNVVMDEFTVIRPG